MAKFPGFPEPKLDDAVLQTLTFQEVTSEEQYDITVYTDPCNDPATILVKSQLETAKSFWFLQEYWHQKKSLVQKICVHVCGHNLNTYVFGCLLQPSETEELALTLSRIASLNNGQLLRPVHTLIVDDVGYQNWQDKSSLNGHHDHREHIIVLFPNSRLAKPHRISAASNFSGTVVHEFAHSLDASWENKWRTTFGWQFCEERQLPGGRATNEYVLEPGRCVTTYASLSSSDDVAESLVAAMYAPDTLDPERLSYLHHAFSGLEFPKLPTISITQFCGDMICLPKAPQTIRYRINNLIRIRK